LPVSDEIVWDAPTPPPKNWHARHKVGEALDDREAAQASAVDDINAREPQQDITEDYIAAGEEEENLARNNPDYEGLVGITHDATKDHTGNPIVDARSIPDYSEYNGFSG